MTTKVQQALPELPPDEGSLLESVRREVFPVLREARSRFNEAFGPVTTVDASQIVDASAQVWLVDASGGAVTLTLPPASGWPMKLYFKKVDSSGNAVTIERDGSDTIDGATSATLASQYDATTMWSDGDSSWFEF